MAPSSRQKEKKEEILTAENDKLAFAIQVYHAAFKTLDEEVDGAAPGAVKAHKLVAFLMQNFTQTSDKLSNVLKENQDFGASIAASDIEDIKRELFPDADEGDIDVTPSRLSKIAGADAELDAVEAADNSTSSPSKGSSKDGDKSGMRQDSMAPPASSIGQRAPSTEARAPYSIVDPLTGGADEYSDSGSTITPSKRRRSGPGFVLANPGFAPANQGLHGVGYGQSNSMTGYQGPTPGFNAYAGYASGGYGDLPGAGYGVQGAGYGGLPGTGHGGIAGAGFAAGYGVGTGGGFGAAAGGGNSMPGGGYGSMPGAGYGAMPGAGYGAMPGAGYGAMPGAGYGAMPGSGYVDPGNGVGGYGFRGQGDYGDYAIAQPYGRQVAAAEYANAAPPGNQQGRSWCSANGGQQDNFVREP